MPTQFCQLLNECYSLCVCRLSQGHKILSGRGEFRWAQIVPSSSSQHLVQMFSQVISSLGWSRAAMEHMRALLFCSCVQLWPELLAEGKVCLKTVLLLVFAEQSLPLWTWMWMYNLLSPVPGSGRGGQVQTHCLLRLRFSVTLQIPIQLQGIFHDTEAGTMCYMCVQQKVPSWEWRFWYSLSPFSY